MPTFSHTNYGTDIDVVKSTLSLISHIFMLLSFNSPKLKITIITIVGFGIFAVAANFFCAIAVCFVGCMLLLFTVE